MPNRLFVDEILSVGLVDAGDNPESEVVIFKARDLDKRKVSTEEREKLADKGQALPDGSFPIANASDLKNAVQAFGRAKNKPAAKKHIIRRAKALGKTDILPEGWSVSKMSSNAESVPIREKVEMDLSAIEDQDLRKAVESAIEARDERIAELEASETPPDPVEKADPEVQALIEKQNEELAKVRDDLEKERKTRRVESFITKAEPFSRLLGKADEMGPVLESLDAAAPEDYAKLESALSAAAQRVDLDKLFSTMGTGEGEGESDPIAKRDAWVEKNRKDDESVTQARGRFWSENPDAVEESRS